jgi:hypothetical protein
VSDDEAAAARAEYDRLRAEIGASRALTGHDMFALFPPIGVMLRHEEQQDRQTHEVEAHVLRIGEAALVTNPFELYQEFGLRMKARCRSEQTLIVQLAGGWGGYLPTEPAVAGGGYGAVVASGTVGPEGGGMLVDETVAMIDGLWEGSASAR